MAPSAQSRASSSRRNITDVIARYDDASITVCKAGRKVGLHFGTRYGQVVVTCDLKEFVLSCRGPIDHNRNPLPSIDDILAEPVLPLSPASRRDDDDARKLPNDILAKFRCALADLNAGVCDSKAEACRLHGIGPFYQSFINWMAKHPAACDGVRAPALKPGGNIL